MDSLDRKDFVDALLLALIAGCVDAVGFLQLGGFFVSFMSGNSTRLGLGIGSSYWREAALAAGIIATFVGGVALGSLIGQRVGVRRRQVLLIAEAVLLAIAAASHQLGHPGWATVPMILSMGIANSVFGVGGDVRFGVTYMTGALVRVGQRIAAVASGGPRDAWKPYAAMWLALVIGASFGARAYSVMGGQILWLPVIILFVLAIFRRSPVAPPSPWKQTVDAAGIRRTVPPRDGES